MENNYQRQNPDEILKIIQNDENQKNKGKLKIFLGMSAGVGKTYAMLLAARDEISKGKNVIIGYIETHKRTETENLLNGLSVLPRKKVEFKEKFIEEFDIDEVLRLKPELVIIDELPHTNTPGSRHNKRYQDILELLDNKINVYTALNVQHIESRKDIVESITGIKIHETVPDSIVDMANEVELIDISPDDLLKRLAEGKVYVTDKIQAAADNFFRKGNLTALREISLRITADTVEQQLSSYMKKENIDGPWKTGERILVAISASPFSASLIRWTKKLSSSLKAKWFAVYIDNLQPLSMENKERLLKNINLAKELGGEILSTNDEDIVSGIINVAKQNNISQIIVGKPFGSRILSIIRGKDTVNRLINESGDIDIHVVRADKIENKKKNIKSLLTLKSNSDLKHYIYSSIIIGLIALICFPFSNQIGYQSVGLIMLLAITLMPLLIGRGPILLAAVLSSLTWNFFFIPPVFTFQINKFHDLLTLIIYLTIAIVAGFLTTKIKDQSINVKQKGDSAVQLYNLTKSLANAINQEQIINIGMEFLQSTFNLNSSFFESNSDGVLQTNINNNLSFSQNDLEILNWSFLNNKKAGIYTDNMPYSKLQFVPLNSLKGGLGVIVLEFKKEGRPNLDSELLLENFITQISAAFEKEVTNNENKKLLLLEESDKLYKNLINSISHEIRTPLAIISGASSTLNDVNIIQNKSLIRELNDEITTASKRLNRLVENLLDMSRLEAGRISLKLDWCDLNDLFSVILEDLKSELVQHKVITEFSENIPMIKADFVLLSQAIINILHNSASYTPVGTEIKIKTTKNNDTVIIEIQDNGGGIPEENLKYIFDKFYRVPGSKTGGTGLGLSITKGLIEAHNGSINVNNKPEGGLKFLIKLPINA